MDIEGAEQLVFKNNISWLKQVDAILIEIHGRPGVISIPSLLLAAGFYCYQREVEPGLDGIYFACRANLGNSEPHKWNRIT